MPYYLFSDITAQRKDWQYFLSSLFYFEPFAIAGKWTVTLASSECGGRRRSDLALITALPHFLGTFSRRGQARRAPARTARGERWEDNALDSQ